MKFRAVIFSITAIFAALAAAGCRDDVQVDPVRGVPRIVEIGGAPAESMIVDFGPALLNSEIVREIRLRNDGSGVVTVHDVLASGESALAFTYSFAPFTIGPNEQVSFKISFRPTAVGDFSGSLTFLMQGGDIDRLQVTFNGMGVDGQCELSSEVLDFGSAVIGSSVPMQVKVLNKSTLAWQVTVGELDSGVGDAAAFAFGAGFAAGDYAVPAQSADGTPGELVIPVEFRPQRIGEYSGYLTIPAPSMCPTQVTLHGAGVEQLLQCAPTVDANGKRVCRVDFGYVNPGGKAVRQVQFTNLGRDAVSLEVLDLTQPPNVEDAPFAVEGHARSFTVPAGGESTPIDLSFAPRSLGMQPGRLVLRTSDPNSPSITVELVGVGGGPKVEAQPLALDYGQVAVDSYQVRCVTIANVGTDVGGTDDDNLLFAAFEDGVWVDKPAEIVGPDAASFAIVDWPPRGYPATGLREGETVEVCVKFAPTSEGLKQATLNIYTNDPDQSLVQVPLTGLGVDLPPCDFDVKPPALNFGLVEPNRLLTLTFSFVNRASNPADACLVSQLDLSSATRDHGFALVNGAVGMDNAVAVPGGGHLDVPVRFAPKQAGTYTAEIVFFVSSPTRPEIHVPLTGVAGAACLMIAPRELPFFTVGVGCNSRQKLVTLYNTCTQNVIITGIDLQQDGASTEFSVTKKPSLPLTLAGGGSTDFGVTYHPVDAGTDTGAVAITTGTAPNATTYLVPLEGTGATDPVQTDVFSQGDQPKVDVLLVIDNSCSMSDKQASLARNFASFIHFAVQQKVDYHIAATTVSLDDPSYECGRFVPLTGTNPRVITPATPNKEQVFSQNVQLGTGGTGTEALIRPAYLALSNPLINGHNAGFYRDEAKLAIVVVSDAADQDPLATPISFYENFFVNLKGVKRRNEFTFSGIIPLMPTGPDYSSGCSYDDNNAGQDPRVKELIRRTGGLQDEICNPDWSKALEKLSTIVFGMRTTFFLSNQPDMSVTPDPIAITVDTLPFPQYGAKGEKRWDYESANNSIVFDRLAVPDPGSTLTISYHVACL